MALSDMSDAREKPYGFFFLQALMTTLTIIQKTKNQAMQSFKTVHQLNLCELKKKMVVFIYIKVGKHRNEPTKAFGQDLA